MKLSAAYNEKFTISKAGLFLETLLHRNSNATLYHDIFNSVDNITQTDFYFRDTCYIFKSAMIRETRDGMPCNQFLLTCFAVSPGLKIIDSATVSNNEEVNQFIRGVIDTLFTGDFINPYYVVPKIGSDRKYEVVRAL